jgi:hypothetical protein
MGGSGSAPPAATSSYQPAGPAGTMSPVVGDPVPLDSKDPVLSIAKILQAMGVQGGGGSGGGGGGAPRRQPPSTLTPPGPQGGQAMMSGIGTAAALVGAIAAMFSSETVKTDIRPLESAESVARAVYAMPVKTWRYKWDDPGRRRLGPMLETMPGYMRETSKLVDLVSMMGSLVATAQSQNERLRKLERRR